MESLSCKKTGLPRIVPLLAVRGVSIFVLAASCAPSGVGGGGSDSESAPTFVALVQPADPTVYTNGRLDFLEEVVGTGSYVEELVTGSQVIGQFKNQGLTWDTKTVAEGTYSVMLRVTFAGTAYDGGTRTVVVDRTPPTATLQPAAGADDVDVRLPIRATFSEPIVGVDLVASISIQRPGDPDGGVPWPYGPALAADGLSVDIGPTQALTWVPPATLYCELSGFADRAGNRARVAPGTWSWHVPQWLPMGSLQRDSTLGGDAVHPFLASDFDAGIALAWLQAGTVQPDFDNFRVGLGLRGASN